MSSYDDYRPLSTTKDSTVTTEKGNIYPLARIILRSTNKKGRPTKRGIYYFNGNGMYILREYNVRALPPTKYVQCIDTMRTSDGHGFDMIDGECFVKKFLIRAIDMLEPGDDVEKLGRLYNSLLDDAKRKCTESRAGNSHFEEISSKEAIERRKALMTKQGKTEDMDVSFEVGQFVQSIRGPSLERDPNNKDKNTFDRIRMFVGIPHTWYMDKKRFIESHKNEICGLVVNKLGKNRSYQKYGVPVNFLRMSSCTTTRQDQIEMLFELKHIDGQKKGRTE